MYYLQKIYFYLTHFHLYDDLCLIKRIKLYIENKIYQKKKIILISQILKINSLNFSINFSFDNFFFI
jgi:hypothetical protein